MSTAPVTKRRRDWFQILRVLMRHGVSMGDVARICNRNQSTVAYWADGGEPKESDARIVLALLAKHAPEFYREHQAQFEIRVEVESLITQGEQRRLAFIDVR
jgi:hypothetical protein